MADIDLSQIDPSYILLLLMFGIVQFILNFAMRDRNRVQRETLFNQMVKDQRADLDEQDKKIEELTKELAEMRKLAESVKSTKDGEIKELQEKLKTLENDLNKIKQDLEGARSHNELLIRERDDARAERDILKTAIDDLKRELHDTRVRLDAMTEAHGKAQSEKMEAVLERSTWEIRARTYETVIQMLGKESPPPAPPMPTPNPDPALVAIEGEKQDSVVQETPKEDIS